MAPCCRTRRVGGHGSAAAASAPAGRGPIPSPREWPTRPIARVRQHPPAAAGNRRRLSRGRDRSGRREDRRHRRRHRRRARRRAGLDRARLPALPTGDGRHPRGRDARAQHPHGIQRTDLARPRRLHRDRGVRRGDPRARPRLAVPAGVPRRRRDLLRRRLRHRDPGPAPPRQQPGPRDAGLRAGAAAGGEEVRRIDRWRLRHLPAARRPAEQPVDGAHGRPVPLPRRRGGRHRHVLGRVEPRPRAVGPGVAGRPRAPHRGRRHGGRPGPDEGHRVRRERRVRRRGGGAAVRRGRRRRPRPAPARPVPQPRHRHRRRRPRDRRRRRIRCAVRDVRALLRARGLSGRADDRQRRRDRPRHHRGARRDRGRAPSDRQPAPSQGAHGRPGSADGVGGPATPRGPRRRRATPSPGRKPDGRFSPGRSSR